MNVLIIGGTRFMGPHIVRQLVVGGHSVAVFTRGQTPIDLPESVRHIRGDRNNLPAFESAFESFRPEVVIDMMLINERQATDLMNMMSGLARRVVIASSCDVYFGYDLLRGVETGEPSSTPLTEDSPLRTKMYPYRDMVGDPAHPLYDYDKILIERIVLSAPELAGTVLRLPVVYGPGDYQHRFFKYLKRMDDTRPVVLLEKAEAGFRMVRGYVEDCAAAIALAATDDRARGRVYNVGEQEHPSESEWVRRLADTIGWSGRILSLPPDQLPEHLKDDTCWEHHLVVDSGRIRRELGYAEIADPAEALRQTIEWERANPPEIDPKAFDYAAEDAAISS